MSDSLAFWSPSTDKSMGHTIGLFAALLHCDIIKLRPQTNQPVSASSATKTTTVYSTNYVQTAETGQNMVRGGVMGDKVEVEGG